MHQTIRTFLIVSIAAAGVACDKADVDEPGTHTGQFEPSSTPNMSVDNTATAKGTDPKNNEVSDTDDESVELPNVGTLTIMKTGTWQDDGSVDGSAEATETVTYSYKVTNTSNLTLTSIGVSDVIEAPGSNLQLSSCMGSCVAPFFLQR